MHFPNNLNLLSISDLVALKSFANQQYYDWAEIEEKGGVDETTAHNREKWRLISEWIEDTLLDRVNEIYESRMRSFPVTIPPD